jgi:hypothetical protein
VLTLNSFQWFIRLTNLIVRRWHLSSSNKFFWWSLKNQAYVHEHHEFGYGWKSVKGIWAKYGLAKQGDDVNVRVRVRAILFFAVIQFRYYVFRWTDTISRLIGFWCHRICTHLADRFCVFSNTLRYLGVLSRILQ